MTFYLSNRDGLGKTSEEGHYKFQTSVFSGNVLGSNALKVTQNSPLGMSVLIDAGQFKVDTGNDYAYTGWNTSQTPLSIATADPANPRITTVVLYIDKGASTSPSPPNNPGIPQLKAINGTPGGVPSAPNGTTIQAAVGAGNPYIILANITVGAAATQIINANISDQRIQVALGTGLVGATSIVDGSVATAELADSAVTTIKLADNSVSTAKVIDGAVTDAKWRNNISFYAYRSGARTLSASTFTLMAADTIGWNYGSGYSNASNAGRFTCTVNGIYQFSSNLATEASANTRVIMEIRKNGVGHRQFDITGSDINRANVTQIFTLNAGDYVESWVWTSASTNIASGETWFEGHIITRI